MAQDETTTPEEKGNDEVIVNPIDGDKVAINPHLLPYAHERGRSYHQTHGRR